MEQFFCYHFHEVKQRGIICNNLLNVSTPSSILLGYIMRFYSCSACALKRGTNIVTKRGQYTYSSFKFKLHNFCTYNYGANDVYETVMSYIQTILRLKFWIIKHNIIIKFKLLWRSIVGTMFHVNGSGQSFSLLVSRLRLWHRQGCCIRITLLQKQYSRRLQIAIFSVDIYIRSYK